jgi:hypothetical protein
MRGLAARAPAAWAPAAMRHAAAQMPQQAPFAQVSSHFVKCLSVQIL